jgi:hypothetical protein
MTGNGSSKYFIGNIALANLFRPQLVRKHFGKSFDQWTAEEIGSLLYDMQRTCLIDRNEFSTSGIRTPLTGVFNRHSSLTAMSIAGIALENAAGWAERSLQILEQGALLRDIDQLENSSKAVTKALWPNESQALAQALPQAYSKAAVRAIENSLKEFSESLDRDDFGAIHSLYRLSTSGLFERLLPEDLERMKAHYFEVTTASLERSIDRFRGHIQTVSNPRERLDQSRDWWHANAELSMEYFSDLINVDELKKWFGEMREEAWNASREWYEAEFAKLDYTSEVFALLDKHSMAEVDTRCCDSWKAISQDQWKRVEEIQHKQYVKRVGEGPYTAEHPGAVYLNAIYRNDVLVISGENARLKGALRAALLKTESGVYRSTTTKTDNWGTTQVLFDGVFYRDAWGGRFLRSLPSAHLLDPMVVFLATAYGHYLPHCVDPNLKEWKLPPAFRPVFKAAQDQTTPDKELSQLERVRSPRIYYRALEDLAKRAGKTEMAYKPGTLEKTLVVHSYVDVFNTVWTRGEGEAVGWMYHSIFRGNWERAEGYLSILNGALQGLRELMEKGDCNDPVFNTLEKNIQSIYGINTSTN